MKKTVLTLLLFTATLFTAWAGKPEKLENLARKYRGEEGFEMISMGRLGMGLLRGVAKISGDFEDIPAAKKSAFTAKAEKILSGMDLILEAKDSDESVRIYGIDDGDSVRDCVLYSSDGALIVTKGKFSLQHLGELMQMAD